ncbi:beta-1,3-galactosyltransferase 2-like [Phaenicophaeus curvirostris]|uniref:beta-1,3-galactosyltransferase 2-like n=1 Tax=Phaenicophaeus curvirostris TaxID=33595 RepID=UPI0037F0EFBF
MLPGSPWWPRLLLLLPLSLWLLLLVPRVPLVPRASEEPATPHPDAAPSRHPLRPPYPHPYRFLLNQPHKCRRRAPFLVLLVATEPRDVAARDAIRATWGCEAAVPGGSVLRLFLLGVPAAFAAELQPVLEEENERHGDLLQQDFVDTYNNLTLKTLMGFEWVAKYCPGAAYVVKADQDVFLNLDFLAERFLLPPKKNFMTGFIYRGTGPIRRKSSKWYVPRELYPNATYPPYCGGPGYVLSADLAAKVYAVAPTVPLINMEDAYVGICLRALGVDVAASPRGAFNMGRVAYEPCRFARLVMVHRYQPGEMRHLWPRFQRERRLCRR